MEGYRRGRSPGAQPLTSNIASIPSVLSFVQIAYTNYSPLQIFFIYIIHLKLICISNLINYSFFHNLHLKLNRP